MKLSSIVARRAIGSLACRALGRAPALGMLEEGSDRRILSGREVAETVRHLEHVPPRGESVQLHALGLEAGHALREDAVVEDHEGVVDPAAGVPDRMDEVELGGALAREILDQEHARALGHLALDLGVAAEALGLL